MKLSIEKKASFDSLYQLVRNAFSKIADPRKSNSHYSLLTMLQAGFAIFSLKSSSMLSFLGLTESEENNLSSIYGLTELPSANGLRKSLDSLEVSTLRVVFRRLWRRISKLGIPNNFRYYRNYLIISIDGVELFCSNKIQCDNCQSRTRQGVTSYHHAMLSAVLVHPDHREVFVMDNEPIGRQDGKAKNDCERNACKRLLKNIAQDYRKEQLLFVMDALFSCAPIVKQLKQHVFWQYLIGIKPDSHKTLFVQFERRDHSNQVSWIEQEDETGKHCYGFTNNLPLNSSNADVRVNVLYYRWYSKKGKKVTFTWVTSILLHKGNVVQLVKAGRSRWNSIGCRIENETFNTLKNQGYYFEHNFGHGKKNLCNVFAFLMMLAFTVDQIQQHACYYFRKLWLALKTKKKLWENIRATFKLLNFDSMQKLFEHIAKINRIQLE